MPPIILHMQDTQENYEKGRMLNLASQKILHVLNAYIYISLHNEGIVSRATNWLSQYNWMKDVCEIGVCNGVNVMRFTAPSYVNQEIGVYLQHDRINRAYIFGLKFGTNKSSHAAEDFATILNILLDTKGSFSVSKGNIQFHEESSVYITEKDTNELLKGLIHPDDAAMLHDENAMLRDENARLHHENTMLRKCVVDIEGLCNEQVARSHIQADTIERLTHENAELAGASQFNHNDSSESH